MRCDQRAPGDNRPMPDKLANGTNVPSGLRALEDVARRDLAFLNYPPANWVPSRDGPDGCPMADVLVIGGGMCGQTVAFGLMREGVRNIRVVDRNAAGSEGSWGTYARMDTLRSPKHLTGPDLGIPSLTFRAWFEAQHGAAAWTSLHKIARLDWLAYLLWVRRVAGIAVANEVEVVTLAAQVDWVEAQLRSASGEETLFARKVVLAMGRDGSGAPTWPAFPSVNLRARGRVFHSSDDIDFSAFPAGRFGVLGVGASAFDNAAVALESGARAAVLFARRSFLPQVNKSKWTAFPGFNHGFVALDDAERWRFYTYIFDAQVPPPHESVLRCERYPGFSIRFAEPWVDVSEDERGVRVITTKGEHRFDAVVIATGFDVNLAERPEFAAFRDSIATWADRVPREAARTHPEAARFPYLGSGFELIERVPGTAPGLRNVHLFNWGSTMSHGAIAGDIPGLGVGAERLAHAIARDLFVADVAHHHAALLAYDEPELATTPYYVTPAGRTG
jgi:FAD-dependent urate hydroxylase